jgi:lysozyme family protein
MKDTFDAYLPELFKHEGGYVDHPADPGGATNFGITLGTLQSFRGKPVSKGDVRNLTKREAGLIYRARYWDAIGGDSLPAGVDAVAFDIAVNHGVGRWRQWAPIIKGLAPDDAIRALCERRRRFYRSLKTFPTFGKGWMRRANEVEIWALKWASNNATDKPSEAKPKTMATSKTGNTAIITAAAGSLAPVNEAIKAAKETADGVSGIMAAGPWVLLALVIVAGAAYIWWDRRKKLVEHGV